MNKTEVFLAQTVKLVIAKDAIEIWDGSSTKDSWDYRCSLTVNKEEAKAIVAALLFVHNS